MSKSKLAALKKIINNEQLFLTSAKKHPVHSGAVKVVQYQEPKWRYGEAHN